MLIALLPGDGIGPEVVTQAKRVLDALSLDDLTYEQAPVGGTAYNASGHPLPEATLDLARRADAILFGAVGDPDCDALERHLRPEQAILGLRKELSLFANLRPAKLFPELTDESALRPEIAREIDMVIVRELNGDVYFGKKGVRTTADGKREGFDIMSYNEDEVRRIARVGFQTAMTRGKRLCSVDKANVLETSQLWRDVVSEVAGEYPEVELSAICMSIIARCSWCARRGNLMSSSPAICLATFYPIRRACARARSVCCRAHRSIKPARGCMNLSTAAAPDIAGQGKANPLATILSAAMMLRYSLEQEEAADRIEAAVSKALADGARSFDLGGNMTTSEMADAVIRALV